MDFNDLFILECFHNKDEREFLDIFTIPSLKDFNLTVRYQFLKKNQFIVEDPNDSSKMILSVKGQDLIHSLLNPPIVMENGKMSAQIQIIDLGKSEDEKFEEWWKTYPSTPKWETDDGNTIFTGSRVLRNVTKANAKKKYLKLLNQGLKHEELIGSLLYEIKTKKMDSIKKGENQLEYFKGMDSYLNSERYLLFIDEFKKNPDFVKDEKPVKGKRRNVTDI